MVVKCRYQFQDSLLWTTHLKKRVLLTQTLLNESPELHPTGHIPTSEPLPVAARGAEITLTLGPSGSPQEARWGNGSYTND